MGGFADFWGQNQEKLSVLCSSSVVSSCADVPNYTAPATPTNPSNSSAMLFIQSVAAAFTALSDTTFDTSISTPAVIAATAAFRCRCCSHSDRHYNFSC